MVQFPKDQVLAACAGYGPQLRVPGGLNGRTVMAAIAQNESSLGADCGPRHEPAYDSGGRFSTMPAQQSLLGRYGHLAASSHGPWQMMFSNFSSPAQASIAAGTMGIDDYAKEFCKFFNNFVIDWRKAASLDEIGQVWNMGHVTPDPAYTDKLQTAYANLDTTEQSNG